MAAAASAHPRSLAQLRAAPGAPGSYLAVMEVVRFAALRRLIGYGPANAIMQLLAERIVAAAPCSEIGRIGRTTIEFAFTADDRDDAQARMRLVLGRLRAPITLDENIFDLAVMIGVVDAAGQLICDELVDAAAAALPIALSDGTGIAFGAPFAADNRLSEDAVLVRHLRHAIARGELQLLYQPKLHARKNRFTSAEALLRWHHPRFGTVPADRFIPLAEQAGVIAQLTDWVLARAVADQTTLVAAGHGIELFVNLSGRLLADRAFAARALAAVADSAAPIGLEITETAVIADPDAALANLHAFRAAGIRIAIDDYGTGLSSLAYLKQLPAQELKIDRMFVSGLIDSHRDPLLVRSSIDLAHALEMEVTAEGVDDPVVMALLRVMGCDLLQGYLISPPVPLPALIALLDADRHVDEFAPSSQSLSNGQLRPEKSANGRLVSLGGTRFRPRP